ncbi:MAG: anthranilate synthase component I family protein [Planctomycetota bacterium]|nr:anthranilate synthase component I family protein [Planctomycetota bacterium]
MSKALLSEPVRCFSRTIEPPIDRSGLRRAVAAFPDGVMLESVAVGPSFGRYSVYALEPVRVRVTGRGDPFDLMNRTFRPWSPVISDVDLAFPPGWIGYLSYESGRFVEPTGSCRRLNHPLPIACWSLFDTWLVHDSVEGQWKAVATELPARVARCERPPASARLDSLEQFAREVKPGGLGRHGPAADHVAGRWNTSRFEYVEKVRRALDYVRAGDIYQVNIARRYRAPLQWHPIEVYQRLCESNPAQYAAYLPVRQSATAGMARAILSSSPELFLGVCGRDVVTRPIKGTRPRVGEGEADRAARSMLAASEKDRAELNMIIDLERNDLGRVCEYGSIRVESDGELETLPTVFHRTATVVGRLRDDADCIDLARAAFPGGSITGAPKVRAMQIIDELEPDPRGPYCGAIGYIGLDGRMRLNLAIRTISVVDGHAEVAVGSGIVADSDPDEEFRETQAKARGMLSALGVEPALESPGRRPADGCVA